MNHHRKKKNRLKKNRNLHQKMNENEGEEKRKEVTLKAWILFMIVQVLMILKVEEKALPVNLMKMMNPVKVNKKNLSFLSLEDSSFLVAEMALIKRKRKNDPECLQFLSV